MPELYVAGSAAARLTGLTAPTRRRPPSRQGARGGYARRASREARAATRPPTCARRLGLGLGLVRVRVGAKGLGLGLGLRNRGHPPARGRRDGGAQEGERHPLVLPACVHHKWPAHPAPAATVEDAAASATSASASAANFSSPAAAATATVFATATATATSTATTTATATATAAVEHLGRGSRIEREAAQRVMCGVVAECALRLRTGAPPPGTAG